MNTATTVARRIRSPKQIDLGDGALADAIRASASGRMRNFIADEESPPIALFSPESRKESRAGDWYGEHAGKWLVAASRTWRRTGDEDLANRISRVATKLTEWQEPNGYLGTYATDADCRISHPNAAEVRTWDIWTHAWTILGLLDASNVPGLHVIRENAIRAGEFIMASASPESLLKLGNHQGLSASIVIEPLARLSLLTGDAKYSDYAELVVTALSDAGIDFLTDADAAELGTGKAYQILWNLIGLTYLFASTGKREYLAAAIRWYENIRDHHLNPLGGPWGGIASHKEVFNQKGYFHPSGLVETCSTATWITLNRLLFEFTGDTAYIHEIERSAFNALLGAADPNGEDWIYFSFPNGRRNNTYHWACCKSSGAMALEEVAASAVLEVDGEILILLPIPGVYRFGEGEIELRVESDFSSFEIEVRSIQAPVRLRIPNWARTNGAEWWSVVQDVNSTLRLSVAPRVEAVTDSLEHHGQEIVRVDYCHLAYGPFIYATGLFDGDRQQETLRLAKLNPANQFTAVGGQSKEVEFDLMFPGRGPIRFEPYYRAGGRHDGAWRTTWLSVAWQ